MKKALVILACLAVPAAAAPKKKKAPPKKPPVEEKAPEPEPAPAPTPVPVPSAVSSEGKPWAMGVPQDVQDKAKALYEEGNTLFAQQAHAPALEKYKQAIALWEHPLIRFNMAVTEIRHFGGASIQVARRLRAMLEALIESLAEERARLLRQELSLLHRSVERFFIEPEDRALANVSDLQGVGGGHGRQPGGPTAR